LRRLGILASISFFLRRRVALPRGRGGLHGDRFWIGFDVLCFGSRWFYRRLWLLLQLWFWFLWLLILLWVFFFLLRGLFVGSDQSSNQVTLEASVR
jgi:hypothetical protein